MAVKTKQIFCQKQITQVYAEYAIKLKNLLQGYGMAKDIRGILEKYALRYSMQRLQVEWGGILSRAYRRYLP